MTSGEPPEGDAGGQLVTTVLDDQSSVIEVAVAGRWTVDLKMRAVTAVRKCLVGHPVGVVIDLQHLHDPDMESISVWFTLRAEADRMAPPVPLGVTLRPGSRLAAAMRLRSARFRLPVFEDLPQARSALTSRWPLTDQVRLDLPPLVSSVAAAEQLVATVCRQWELGTVAPRARLVTSLLILNAAEHAGTDLEFTVTRLGPPQPGPVRRGSGLQLGVHDLDPRLPPRPAKGGSPAESSDPAGPGLRLIDATADTWGALPTRRGKLVWAVLRRRP